LQDHRPVTVLRYLKLCLTNLLHLLVLTYLPENGTSFLYHLKILRNIVS